MEKLIFYHTDKKGNDHSTVVCHIFQTRFVQDCRTVVKQKTIKNTL